MNTYVEITDGKYKGMRGYVKSCTAFSIAAYLYKNCNGMDAYKIPHRYVRVIEPAEVFVQKAG
jgi:hypothetical protein